MSVETSWLSSPFGPLTATRPGATSTVTPSGSSMGFLPMRLMISSPVSSRRSSVRSPNVGDDLAADAGGLRLVAGHHAARGADDRRAGPAVHPRDGRLVDVAPAARPGDPLEAGDHRLAILG